MLPLSLGFSGYALLYSVIAIGWPVQLSLHRDGYVLRRPLTPKRRISWTDIESIRLWSNTGIIKGVVFDFKPGKRPSGFIFRMNRLLGIGAGLPAGWRAKPEALKDRMKRLHRAAEKRTGQARPDPFS